MRILHLDGGHDWAGGQNQVRLLMRELQKQGLEQLCVCPKHSPLGERLRADGLPVRETGWLGGSDPRAMFAVARRVPRCDIVHCHDAHALQVAWLPTRLFKTKLVATRRVHFRTTAAKWNRADAVVAISRVVENSLINARIRLSRLHLIRSGIDLAELTALEPMSPRLRASLSLPSDAFVVGSIGKLAEYKGQSIIPRTAARTPGVHWIVIGDGPLRPSIEQSIGALDVAERVHLTGTIPDARRALREFDLFLFPSPDEPLGTSVLDAMAAGVPVVAANAAGAAEILAPVHAKTRSSLYTPGDAGELAKIITRLQQDEAQRSLMVQEQLVRVRDFDISRTADKIVALYRLLLNPAL